MAQEGLQHEILCDTHSCSLKPRLHGSSPKYDLLRQKYPVLFHSGTTGVQTDYSLVLFCFHWEAQAFCPVCIIFNVLLLAKLHSLIASKDHWKWEWAQPAHIDINTPHCIINTFGKIRPTNPFSYIQSNHHLPESSGEWKQHAGVTGVHVSQKAMAMHCNLCACAVNRSGFVSKTLQGSDKQSMYGA